MGGGQRGSLPRRIAVVGFVVGGDDAPEVRQQSAAGRHQIGFVRAQGTVSAVGGNGSLGVDRADGQGIRTESRVTRGLTVQGFVAHGRHGQDAGPRQGGHGRADSGVGRPVDGRQRHTDAVGIGIVQGPGAGGQKIPRPLVPDAVEVVVLDDGQAPARGHAPVVRIAETRPGHDAGQGRTVVVVVPGADRLGEVVADVVPTDDLVAVEHRPTLLGGKPVQGVADLRGRSIDVVVGEIAEIIVGRVAARVQDGHRGAPVSLDGPGTVPGHVGADQLPAVPHRRRPVPVQQQETRSTIGNERRQADLIHLVHDQAAEMRLVLQNLADTTRGARRIPGLGLVRVGGSEAEQAQVPGLPGTALGRGDGRRPGRRGRGLLQGRAGHLTQAAPILLAAQPLVEYILDIVAVGIGHTGRWPRRRRSLRRHAGADEQPPGQHTGRHENERHREPIRQSFRTLDSNDGATMNDGLRHG